VITKGKETLELQFLDELDQRDVYVEGELREPRSHFMCATHSLLHTRQLRSFF
jgi:hypothetical protein